MRILILLSAIVFTVGNCQADNLDASSPSTSCGVDTVYLAGDGYGVFLHGKSYPPDGRSTLHLIFEHEDKVLAHVEHPMIIKRPESSEYPEPIIIIP